MSGSESRSDKGIRYGEGSHHKLDAPRMEGNGLELKKKSMSGKKAKSRREEEQLARVVQKDILLLSAGFRKNTGEKNKNCHYCEHAPKRCSSIACDTCDQIFCGNCCKRHLQEINLENFSWTCPICRMLCCCTEKKCTKNHLHCKRYRRRFKQEQRKAMKDTMMLSEGIENDLEMLGGTPPPVGKPVVYSRMAEYMHGSHGSHGLYGSHGSDPMPMSGGKRSRHFGGYDAHLNDHHYSELPDRDYKGHKRLTQVPGAFVRPPSGFNRLDRGMPSSRMHGSSKGKNMDDEDFGFTLSRGMAMHGSSMCSIDTDFSAADTVSDGTGHRYTNHNLGASTLRGRGNSMSSHSSSSDSLSSEPFSWVASATSPRSSNGFHGHGHGASYGHDFPQSHGRGAHSLP